MSSASCAVANQVKFIHAHHSAVNAIAYPIRASA